jgi:Putative restriction endonuclease
MLDFWMQVDAIALHVDAIQSQVDVMPLHQDVMPLQGDVMPSHPDIMPLHLDAIRLQGDALRLQADVIGLQVDVLNGDRNTTSYEAIQELRCIVPPYSPVPDISVVAIARLADEDGPFNGAPDWLIEIRSPDQSTLDLQTKILHCLSNGT